MRTIQKMCKLDKDISPPDGGAIEQCYISRVFDVHVYVNNRIPLYCVHLVSTMAAFLIARTVMTL